MNPAREPAPGLPRLPQDPPRQYRPPQDPASPVSGRPRWLLAAAGAWSAGLIAAAVLIHPSLVQVNGPKVLLPVSAPLAVVGVVAAALAIGRARSGRGCLVVAWAFSGLLDCLALVGMLTIGVFILPVAIAVTAACAMS